MISSTERASIASNLCDVYIPGLLTRDFFIPLWEGRDLFEKRIF